MDDGRAARDRGGIHLRGSAESERVSERAIMLKGRSGVSVSGIVKRQGIAVFAVALIAAACLASPSFRSSQNIQNVLITTAPLGLVVLGQAFVILVRGLDLSVASVMATSAVIATSFGDSNAAVAPIFGASLVMGLMIGLVNGWLVTQRNVSPFLATFATMIVLQSIRFAWTKGAPSGGVPPAFRILGTGTLAGIPLNVIVVAAAAALLSLALARTSFGRKVYIVGGSPRAAELIGIRPNRIIVACYAISSMLAAIGGLTLVGYVGSVDNWVGRGYELDSIVACVVGGVALSGGRGSLFGALLGALILSVVFNIVLLLGLPVHAQFILKGMVIIGAAAAYGANRQARS
jgi:ribose/xylose/arabinose/galactoside ABC-type transport system permease subunit